MIMASNDNCIEINNLVLPAAASTEKTGISFQVETGQLVLIQGLKAADYSVLLRMIAGLTPSAIGTVMFWGQTLDQINRRWLNEHVRFISSKKQPGFSYLVEEYILLGCEQNFKQVKTDKSAQLLKAQAVSRALGIDHLARRDCTQIGRSDWIRVSLAQSMMCSPALILIDDPIDQLVPSARDVIIQFLSAEAKQGRTILLTFDSIRECPTDDYKLIVLGDAAGQDEENKPLEAHSKNKTKKGFLF